MNTKNITQIGMREFMRNTQAVKAKIAQGQTFEVLEHSTPVFRLIPITTKTFRQYQLADLSQFQFSGPATLSQKIDEELYG